MKTVRRFLVVGIAAAMLLLVVAAQPASADEAPAAAGADRAPALRPDEQASTPAAHWLVGAGFAAAATAVALAVFATNAPERGRD